MGTEKVLWMDEYMTKEKKKATLYVPLSAKFL